MSNFNLRQRNHFGPRFGDLMGKLCHTALTASNRKDRVKYDDAVREIYQMLDDIEQNTAWSLDEYTKAAEKRVEKKNEPTPVAPKAKPVAKSPGNKKPAKKRTPKATKLSDGYGDND